jgi:hypothetical protein
MAIAPVNKFISVAVPVAPGENKLYEVPTGTSALVLYAQVANVGIGQTYPTVTFIQRRETRSTGNTRDIRVIKDVEIPPNDAVILIDGRLVLEKTPLIIDRLYITGIQTGITTITNVLYNEPAGIVTVTTSAPHGFDSGSEITMAGIAFTCPSGTGITTTIFPDPQKSYVVDTIIDSVGTSRTFTSVVGGAVGYKHVYNAAIHDFVRARKDAVTLTGGPSYTPSGAEYNSNTGIVTFSIPCHGMLDSTATNLKDPGAGTAYNANVGILTVHTTTTHGYDNGDLIRFDDDALTFTCAMDSNTAEKKYPRASDPTRGVWLPISNKTASTFELNVGKSPLDYFSVQTANYNSTSGIMTATIGSHKLSTGTSIKLANKSIRFRCAQDNFVGIHTYPRPAGYGGASSNDLAYDTAVNIQAVTDTTITIDVGSSSYVGVHTFVSAPDLTVTVADYTPQSGIMTCTIANHGMDSGDGIKFATESLTFSCGYCGAIGVSSQKSYPREKDYANNRWLRIDNVTTNTFEVQVLDTIPSTNTDRHYFESATTGGVTRGVVVSGGDYKHTFVSAVSGSMKRTNKTISITDNSLIFKCSMDNFLTEHSYPRATDPVSGINTALTRADYNTISAYVGVSSSGGLVGPLQMEFLSSILENSNA